MTRRDSRILVAAAIGLLVFAVGVAAVWTYVL